MVKIERNSVEIRCKNNEKTIKVDIGSTLYDVFQQLNLQMANLKFPLAFYLLYHLLDQLLLKVVFYFYCLVFLIALLTLTYPYRF